MAYHTLVETYRRNKESVIERAYPKSTATQLSGEQALPHRIVVVTGCNRNAHRHLAFRRCGPPPTYTLTRRLLDHEGYEENRSPLLTI